MHVEDKEAKDIPGLYSKVENEFRTLGKIIAETNGTV